MVAIVHFLHGQRIGIGPQANCLLAITDSQRGDHTRFANAFGDAVTPAAQQIGDVASRLHFIKSHLGMAMQMVTPGLHLLLIGMQNIQ